MNEKITMSEEKIEKCPHCGKELSPWEPPEQGTWTHETHYVCFSDECPYFIRGWNWMLTKFQQRASYRFRYIPSSGEKGPLPVWSREALKNRIIKKEEH